MTFNELSLSAETAAHPGEPLSPPVLARQAYAAESDGVVDLATELARSVALRRTRALSGRIQDTTRRLMGALEALGA